MKILYIIRGHSGSGKSTLADKLTPWHVSADMFMVDESGSYQYNKGHLSYCHAKCRHRTEEMMIIGRREIAVHNTFTRKWEYAPYLELAEQYGYTVQEIICRGNFQNVHGVPDDVVRNQKQRIEL